MNTKLAKSKAKNWPFVSNNSFICKWKTSARTEITLTRRGRRKDKVKVYSEVLVHSGWWREGGRIRWTRFWEKPRNLRTWRKTQICCFNWFSKRSDWFTHGLANWRLLETNLNDPRVTSKTNIDGTAAIWGSSK